MPDEAVQVEYDILRRKTSKDCVLDLLIDFLRELLHFIVRAPDQCDYIVENRVELAALEDFLTVALCNVEDGVTGSDRYFGVLVYLQALRDRRNDVVEELDHDLAKLVIVLFELLVDGQSDKGEPEESRAAIGDVGEILSMLAEENDANFDSV